MVVPSSENVPLTDSERQRIAALVHSEPALLALARRFTSAGHQLAIVGGPVRDALMDRASQDWDLTTSARPEVIEELIAGWADAVWDVGREFGTIALRKGSAQIEITTYRSDEYDPTSRKPQVRFGDSLDGDLSRRDFAVNAMAVRISGEPDNATIDWTFVDPHGGLADLTTGVLRTPVAAGISFGDDPLRMMRAARFAAQLGFAAHPEVVAAIEAMAERLDIVSAERIRDELVKLLSTDEPTPGLRLLVDTGLADVVLLDNFEVPRLREAVAMVKGHLVTEASGGITLDTVAAIAETGVDYVSSGALTHSVINLDIGLDIEM
jgi:poly(A) polymerase